MIPGLLRARAAELERAGRSRLCVELMRAAAGDAEAGGIVAALFRDDPATPGSVPELRLLAALHDLVLRGDAPELARHYPSAGGEAPAAAAWPAARRALAEHEPFIRARLGRTVQTNEPGRWVGLYGGLLWLAERHGLPVRLLEIGASAGLNLNADRFRYVVGGAVLGDPSSPLSFDEPWRGTPVADPAATAARLSVAERAGCDRRPLDAASREGRLELLSYIWPDEPERLARVARAAEVAARHPVAIARRSAGAWLDAQLAAPRPDVLTVVWQSVVNQYLDDGERAAIRAAFGRAGGGPLVWLTLEPSPAGSDDGTFELRCRERPQRDRGDAGRLLARAGYHGPPVVWELGAGTGEL